VVFASGAADGAGMLVQHDPTRPPAPCLASLRS
jgi:hypothetical protein